MRGNSGKASADKPAPADVLTPRERELLADVMAKRSNLEIAEARSISSNTVKFHLKNVYQKLGVSSRRQIHRFHAGGSVPPSFPAGLLSLKN